MVEHSPEPAQSSAQRQLFDIQGVVGFFRENGADSATTNFARGLISSGQIPAIKIGKKFFVRRTDLEAWIERRAGRRR